MSKNTTAMTQELTRRQLDVRRRQAIQLPQPRYVEPTLPERINRLNPSERYQLQALVRSLKLRKIIRRTLAEAFWLGEQRKALNTLYDSQELSMQQLRSTLQGRESLMSYERALTSFEPVYTHSSYGDGNDSPAVKRALEQSLLIQR